MACALVLRVQRSGGCTQIQSAWIDTTKQTIKVFRGTGGATTCEVQSLRRAPHTALPQHSKHAHKRRTMRHQLSFSRGRGSRSETTNSGSGLLLIVRAPLRPPAAVAVRRELAAPAAHPPPLPFPLPFPPLSAAMAAAALLSVTRGGGGCVAGEVPTRSAATPAK
jgi:hypothetical protein